MAAHEREMNPEPASDMRVNQVNGNRSKTAALHTPSPAVPSCTSQLFNSQTPPPVGLHR